MTKSSTVKHCVKQNGISIMSSFYLFKCSCSFFHFSVNCSVLEMCPVTFLPLLCCIPLRSSVSQTAGTCHTVDLLYSSAPNTQSSTTVNTSAATARLSLCPSGHRTLSADRYCTSLCSLTWIKVIILSVYCLI